MSDLRDIESNKAELESNQKKLVEVQHAISAYKGHIRDLENTLPEGEELYEKLMIIKKNIDVDLRAAQANTKAAEYQRDQANGARNHAEYEAGLAQAEVRDLMDFVEKMRWESDDLISRSHSITGILAESADLDGRTLRELQDQIEQYLRIV